MSHFEKFVNITEVSVQKPLYLAVYVTELGLVTYVDEYVKIQLSYALAP